MPVSVCAVLPRVKDNLSDEGTFGRDLMGEPCECVGKRAPAGC